MNYAKPEITSLASAGFAIQGTADKKVVSVVDSLQQYPRMTIPAYEADE
jgi:hypothetical protein